MNKMRFEGTPNREFGIVACWEWWAAPVITLVISNNNMEGGNLAELVVRGVKDWL